MTLRELDSRMDVEEFAVFRAFDAAHGLPDAIAAQQRATGLAMFHRAHAKDSSAEPRDYLPRIGVEAQSDDELMATLRGITAGMN